MSDAELNKKFDATRAALVVVAREVQLLMKRIVRLERLLAPPSGKRKSEAA
jgi:hypothetical protein